MFTLGEDENTALSPMRISPEVGRSRPAIARSVVVLPQPEGPSSVRCSPAPTVKLTPRTAMTAPYRTTRSPTSIEVVATLLAPGLDGASRHREQDHQRHRDRQGLE